MGLHVCSSQLEMKLHVQKNTVFWAYMNSRKPMCQLRREGYATENQGLLRDPCTHHDSTAYQHHTVVMVPRSIRKRESPFTCLLYNQE